MILRVDLERRKTVLSVIAIRTSMLTQLETVIPQLENVLNVFTILVDPSAINAWKVGPVYLIINENMKFIFFDWNPPRLGHVFVASLR